MSAIAYEGINIQIKKAQEKIIAEFGKQLDSGKAVVQPYTLRVLQFIKNGESSIELNTSAKHSVKELEDIERKVDEGQHFYGYSMGYGVAKIPYVAENGVYTYFGGAALGFSYPNKEVFNVVHGAEGLEQIQEIHGITNLFQASIDFGKGYGTSMKNFDTSYFLDIPNFNNRAGISQREMFKTVYFDSASNKITIGLPRGDRRLLSGIMTGIAKPTRGYENIVIIEARGFLVSTGNAV